MTQDPIEIIRLRNDFYRDNYRRLMVALVFSFVALLTLASTLFYLVLYPSRPRYFSVSESGQMVPLVPHEQPNLSDSAVLQWTTHAVIRAFSYNYVNYREALQELRKNFTHTGWKDFVHAFNEANNLSAVIDRKLVVSAVPTGVPVIVDQGIRHGVYTWKIQIPMLVTYQSASEMSPQSFQTEILVKRVSTLESIQGIAIQQLIQIGSGSVKH